MKILSGFVQKIEPQPLSEGDLYGITSSLRGDLTAMQILATDAVPGMLLIMGEGHDKPKVSYIGKDHILQQMNRKDVRLSNRTQDAYQKALEIFNKKEDQPFKITFTDGYGIVFPSGFDSSKLRIPTR